MDRPICTGLRTPMHLRKVGRMIAPMMPVMTTRNRGDGGYAAEHFGYRDRNRSCYRFRHERKRRAFAQTEQMAEEQHAADGYHRADERAEQDGQQVFQQYIQLAVNRDRKRYRCRRQEERDRLAGFLIGLVGGAGAISSRPESGNQQRIGRPETGFLLNLYAKRIKPMEISSQNCEEEDQSWSNASSVSGAADGTTICTVSAVAAAVHSVVSRQTARMASASLLMSFQISSTPSMAGRKKNAMFCSRKSATLSTWCRRTAPKMSRGEQQGQTEHVAGQQTAE